MTASLHEDFERAKPPKRGSDRNFGMVMATVFLTIAGIKLWHASSWWPAWAGVSAAFAACAWLRPDLLAPLNRVWFHFGLLLHKVVSPAVMALLFFGVVLPVGLLMRLFGHRPMTAAFDRSAQSYWTQRSDPTSPEGSMKRQF
ncbi:MAG: hypothetical protein JO163_05845 [Methylobacteriaceae bacterium]|nr:hypothetical protein [Methylobacteriaceae bacterium]